MAEPDVLPLRSPLEFQAGTREAVLDAWNEGIAEHRTNVQFNSKCVAIERGASDFELTLGAGESVRADTVVLAIGLQGNLRTLGVPGEDASLVQYQLDDPDEYHGETIVVVGAGDAAIENAIALSANNKVFIVNRRDEFARAKDGNLQAITRAIDEGTITCYYGTTVECVSDDGEPDLPGRIELNTSTGTARVPCHRVIARLGAIPPRRFVESCGVEFPNDDPASVPAISSRYETNVPGLYIIGALAGYPLIKQAMNQGYEVVEFIQGNDVEPADEPLLREKFAAMPGFTTVDDALIKVQRDIPLLAGITPLQLREFMLDSEVRTPGAGETVFERNDYTNSFFSILAGGVKISSDGETHFQLRAGEFFGEMSLISGRRRSATVTAEGKCVLIETPRRSMNKLINSVDAVRRVIDEMFILRALQSRFTPRTPTDVLAPIAAQCEVRRYKPGEALFEEGDEGDGLHLVRIGSLTVSRMIAGREVILSYVAAGNYVGEMALMGNAPRSATARAAIATETIVLGHEAFSQLLKTDGELRLRMQAEYRQRTAAALEAEAESTSSGSDIISFLVQQGVGEATDILLIDEALCVGCDNCEKACAETHEGNSRLDREAGPTFAAIHVPTSCRHCEHPHCMKDCPPDAIHRAPDGEVYIADNCIGCGNCETHCPYGVIHMAGPMPAKPGSWAWLLFGLGPGPGEDVSARGRVPGEKKAVKCDMCKGIAGGPACVRSCPTGAAIRISPEELPAYAQSRV